MFTSFWFHTSLTEARPVLPRPAGRAPVAVAPRAAPSSGPPPITVSGLEAKHRLFGCLGSKFWDFNGDFTVYDFIWFYGERWWKLRWTSSTSRMNLVLCWEILEIVLFWASLGHLDMVVNQCPYRLTCFTTFLFWDIPCGLILLPRWLSERDHCQHHQGVAEQHFCRWFHRSYVQSLPKFGAKHGTREGLRRHIKSHQITSNHQGPTLPVDPITTNPSIRRRADKLSQHDMFFFNMCFLSLCFATFWMTLF